MIDPVVFLLVFIRVSLILMFIPMFGSPMIPWIVKAGFSLLLSICILSSMNVNIETLSNGMLFLSIISDFVVALSIGIIARFIFDGIQLAGEFISYEMGFTVVNIIDPLSNVQVSLLSQLKQLIAILVFFGINAHYLLIKVIFESFKYIPLGKPVFSEGVFENIIKLSSKIFLLGFRLSVPVIITMFIVNIALGIMNKVMPQLNIFILSFPIYIGLGLLIMGIFMPFFVRLIKESIDFMIAEIYRNIQLMGV